MDNVDKKEILADLKKSKDLSVLKNSDGGRLIIDATKNDILGILEGFSQYKTLTLQEFIALSAKLTTLLSLYQVLTQSDVNEKVLSEILKKIEQEA